MSKTGYVIRRSGDVYKNDSVTMTRGCPHTREFAENSGIATSLSGISCVIPDDVSFDALEKLHDIIYEKMSAIESKG